MTLRAKTLVIIGCTLAALIGTVALISSRMLGRGFAQLENREVRRSLDQSQAAIEELREGVDVVTRDWATWDDCYRFIGGEYPGFVASNLTDETLGIMKLQVMLFVTASGRLWRAEAGAHSRLPSLAVLRKAGLLLPEAAAGRQGILRLPQGLLLVSSRPILTSEARGPARGVLVCGRYLDRPAQQLLSQSLGLRLQVFPCDGRMIAPVAALAAQAHGDPGGEGEIVSARDPQTVTGLRLLPDLRGGVAAALQVEMPRAIVTRGRETVRHLLTVMTLAGAFLGLAALLALERLVLSRLRWISDGLERIVAAQDPAMRLPRQGSDELGRVVEGFNHTLEALETAEGLYRETINALPDWVYVVDEDLRIEVSNNGFRQFCQNSLAAERLRGHGLLEAFPCLGQDVAAQCREVLSSGHPRQAEVQPAICRGSVHTETRWVPIIEHGRVARVLTITRDITRRKWDELALRLAEEKFRRLFEEAPVGIFQASLDGKLLAANDALAQLLGYGSAGELLWGASADPALLALGSGDAEKATAQALADGEPVRLLQEYRGQDGRLVTAWLKLRAARDQRGNPQLLEGFVDDVTEQKRAEARLSRTLEDLARSNTELEQFAYVASHDLQEPLRMITSYLQLLARRYHDRLDEDAEEFIGFAVEGAARMQRLIADLLAYSRVGSRGQEFAPVDLAEVLREVRADLEVTLAETQAVITHDPLPVVWGDGVQLAQLLRNLVANALKFRQEGQAPRVHVMAEETGDGWRLGVGDNGIGLDPSHAERIFVIFQRLHSREQYPGTGIGLAICKRIAERHGGRIWVESQPGQGAAFHFTLQRRAEGEDSSSWAA